MRHRVDVVGRVEVDLVDLVDDIAKEVAGEHPVVRLLEHRGKRVSRIVLTGAGQLAEVRQQLAVDEVEQLGPSATRNRIGGPVAPSVRLLDRGAVVAPGELATLLESVERAQEEQPGKLRDPVEVAVEARV